MYANFYRTDQDSFLRLKSWLEELGRSRCEENLELCVLGNKLDLNPYRKVPKTNGDSFALNIGASYFETSAYLRGKGIQEAFQDMGRRIFAAGLAAPENSGTSGISAQAGIKIKDSSNSGTSGIKIKDAQNSGTSGIKINDAQNSGTFKENQKCCKFL